MRILNKEFEPYISYKEIPEQVLEVDKQIDAEFQNDNLIILVILKGVSIFSADILKQIRTPYQVEFLKYNSYVDLKSSVILNTEYKLPKNLEDKYAIVIEDVIETGNKKKKIVEQLQSEKIKNLKVCSLLFKPKTLQQNIKTDYIGFEIPNYFLINYGLD